MLVMIYTSMITTNRKRVAQKMPRIRFGFTNMVLNSRHIKLTDFLKLSLFTNLVVLLYMFLNTEIISERRHDLLRRRSNALLPWDDPANLEGIDVEQHVQGTGVCRMNILLFGMKEHWKLFCLFKGMSRFKDLVVFPRNIQCPEVPECNVTLSYSMEARDIRNADIVVFTNVYGWLTPEMWAWAHGNRSSERQPWAMVSVDSPMYVPGLQPPTQYVGTTYNWIASYKPDSDVHLPYGYYQPFPKPLETELDMSTFLQGKEKLLAWLGSNCDTSQWDRMRLVQDIKRQLRLDTYGECGEMDIPWNNQEKSKEILGQYRFYLSLENSCCDDYISGKLWRALDLGVVPVVVGASLEQYKRVAPPGSFIHVGEFSSLTELLIRLTKDGLDDQKYLKYFQWRNKGRILANSHEDQYVTPLKGETHCSLLQKYMASNRTVGHKPFNYMGPRWAGSCKQCGEEGHWIQNYMKPK